MLIADYPSVHEISTQLSQNNPFDAWGHQRCQVDNEGAGTKAVQRRRAKLEMGLMTRQGKAAQGMKLPVSSNPQGSQQPDTQIEQLNVPTNMILLIFGDSHWRYSILTLCPITM